MEVSPEVTVSFGQYGLPVVLTILMGVIFKVVNMPDKWKALLTIAIGTGLGILGLFYQGHEPTLPLIVDYALFGFMSGAGAVGLYEGVYRTAANPRS